MNWSFFIIQPYLFLLLRFWETVGHQAEKESLVAGGQTANNIEDGSYDAYYPFGLQH
jgi:hypothetical protein